MTTLPILRRSAIQTAASCLFRYDKLWRQGVPDQSDPSLIGIGFHSCAHAYVTRLVQAQVDADEEEARHAFPEGIAAALTPAHLIPDVKAIYAGWVRHFAVDLGAFLAAEERQEGNNRQSFVPDIVYGRREGLEIVDFKTYRIALTETQLRNDWQARWYMFNAMRIFPNFPSYRFTHSYVRWGGLVSVLFEPSELEGFADEVEAIAARIEEAEKRDEWPATPGPDCSFCSLDCPVANHPDVVPARLIQHRQAVDLAGKIMAGEAWIKSAKKALKPYVAANRTVEVNGVVWDNRPSQARSYPIGEVVKALEKWAQAGAFSGEVDTSQGLTVSHSALSRLFKVYPELLEALEPSVQTKTVYRFSGRKPGVGDDEEEE